MPLESGVRRALGRILIQGLVPQGLGANEIVRALRRGGVSYRNKDMYADIRLFSGKQKYEDAVRAVPGSDRVPKRYMVETTFKRPYKYKVMGDVTYYDPVAGQEWTEEKSFYTDEWIPKDDWVEKYKNVDMSAYRALEREFVGMEIRSVEHNEAMSY